MNYTSTGKFLTCFTIIALCVLFSFSISPLSFAQHSHSATDVGTGTFSGLNGTHAPVLRDNLYGCFGCNNNTSTQSLTIFKFQNEDYPFLIGDVMYMISPNPYAFTTFAGNLPPEFFGPNLIITDNDPLDADPTKGVIELVGVNEGVYSIWELKGPPGVLKNNIPFSSEYLNNTSNPYPLTGITNHKITFSSSSESHDIPPPQINQTQVNTLMTKGAKINGGSSLSSADHLPSSKIIGKTSAFVGTAPSYVEIASPPANLKTMTVSNRLANLGIPTYSGPVGSDTGSAFIPPVFVTNTGAGNLILPPKITSIPAGNTLVIRTDNIHQFSGAGHGSGHTTNMLRGITLPIGVDKNDLEISIELEEKPPSGILDLDPTLGNHALFLNVTTAGDADFSNPGNFFENPTIGFSITKNADNTCPTNVTVYLYGSNNWNAVRVGGHAHPPTRDALHDTATLCAYTQEVEHFSSYLVGVGGSGSGHGEHGGSGGSGGHSGHGSGAAGHAGHGGHGGHGDSGMVHDGPQMHPHEHTIMMITQSLNIFSVKYNLDHGVVLVTVGTNYSVDDLEVQAHGIQSGLTMGRLAKNQPYENENQSNTMKKFLFEIPIANNESFIRVAVDDRQYQLVQTISFKDRFGEIIPWYANPTELLHEDHSSHSEDEHDKHVKAIKETGFELKFDGQIANVLYKNHEFLIKHSKVAQITGIEVDEQLQGVSFLLADSKPGEFIIQVPRQLVSDKTDKFIVMVTASPEQQVGYSILGSDDDSFTMSVELPSDASKLTIIGTQIIPEFGVLASLVLVMSIMAIVFWQKFYTKLRVY